MPSPFKQCFKFGTVGAVGAVFDMSYEMEYPIFDLKRIDPRNLGRMRDLLLTKNQYCARRIYFQ